MTHISTIVINVPQIGVHRPRSKNTPAPAPIICGETKAMEEASLRCPKPSQIRNVAQTRRCVRRPVPGQPLGNTEKRRCKRTSYSVLSGLECTALTTYSKRLNGVLHLILSGDLKLDNSSLQPNRDGVGPVVSAKLGKNVRDVAFHACFSDRQLAGNLFVRISTGD